MRTILSLAIIAAIGASGVALADNASRLGETSGQGASVSAATMKARIDQLGYDVRALKADGEVYKVYLVDRESGQAVKAAFSETTGELVGAKPARDDSARERNEAGEHREKHRHEPGRDHGRRGAHD